VIRSDGLALPLIVWLSSFFLGQRPAAHPGLPKRIPVPKYGFSVERPDAWRARVWWKDGLPIFVNFPWSEMGAQLTLPEGGASINLISFEDAHRRRRRDDSLAGWANFDAALAAPGTLASAPLDVPAPTGISEALLTSFNVATFSRDDQAQRHVSVYWAYRKEKFAAHLFYVVGDPKGASYGNVLRQVVFSIRPVA